MKKYLLLLLLFAPIALFAQDFIVAANAQRTLTPAERTLSVKKFSLGDGAVIIIPAEMNGWTVTATDVSIGNNVKILSVSPGGYSGMNGSPAAGAPDCRAGMPGMNATNGIAGTPGKGVSLNLKIRNIGSLSILVNGANGGNGGYGGNGGKGGNANCTCNAGNGGYGGKGGNGGNGGAGGNVSIIYSKIGSVTVSNSNFIVQNSGGAAGRGGEGGAGGPGGLGGGCPDSKALVRPGGLAGSTGPRGSNGIPGSNGTTTISGR